MLIKCNKCGKVFEPKEVQIKCLYINIYLCKKGLNEINHPSIST